MRVIRCPNCQEPLPGTANYCAKCGEYLPISEHTLHIIDENLVAPTIKIVHLPAALKVAHFYVDSGNNSSTHHSSSRIAATAQRPRRNALFSDIQTIPVTQPRISESDVNDDELQSRANWEKVVTYKTFRVAAVSVTPPDVPVVYKPPVGSTPPALISIRRTPPKKPPRLPMRLFSWVSILVMISLLLGGVFGLAVSFGRGFLAQSSHTIGVFALQVTPSTAAFGGIITLHGSSFSPSGKIGLTRDSNITLVDAGGTNIIHADHGGSFSDTVIIDPSWGAGPHIIRAEDAILHKSASFTVSVTGHSASLHPSHLLFSKNTIDLGSGDQATNSTQIVKLSNAGGGQITWQATATQSWLAISPKSGTFSYGQGMNVAIAVDRYNLKVGTYADSLIFTSNTGQATLPVKMVVTQLQPGHEAVLQLTPAVLSFTGTDGGTNPLAQVVTVRNPGVLSLKWNATSVTNDGSGWLSVYPLSGTVTKGGSQAVTISVNISTLLPGVYSGSLTFASQGTIAAIDSPQTIFVSLVVLPQCSIQISPGGLTFASDYLQPSPARKVISLGVSQGCSTALPWNTTVTTSSGGKWLSIGPRGGVTPASPAINVTSTGLKPGTYNGSIIFNWAGGSQNLPISFIVGQVATPIVTATSATIPFSGIIGQKGPTAQKVTISNTGGNTLVWRATAVTAIGGAWLAITPLTGTIAPHLSTPITVTAKLLATLTAGTYTGTITITGTDRLGHPANGSPLLIPVNFVVQAPCSVTATTPALVFQGVAGGANPATQTITVSVIGACTGNVTVTPTAILASGTGWLAVSPSPATVISGGSATFTVTVASSALATGKYTGSISLAAVNRGIAISGSPHVVGITLNVLAPPALTAGPGSVAFNVSTGTVSQPVTITNSGGSALNWTAALGIGAPSYVSLSAVSGTNLAGGTTASISLIVNATGLAGGTSVTTSVVISAIDPLTGHPVTGSPVDVPVTINIPPPLMMLSATALAFTTTAGTNPSVKTINIQNPGGNTLTWTVGTSSQPWLTVTPTTGSDTTGQSTLLTFNVNAIGLAASSVPYTATVVITPSVGAAVTVTVTLTVN